MTLTKPTTTDLDWSSWPGWPNWFGSTMFDLPALWTEVADGALKVEEFERDGHAVVRVEMPGIDPDRDVEITVEDGRLFIRAERRTESTTDDTKGYRSEFRYGAFQRTLPLPPGATEADIAATYADGILEVRIPVDMDKAGSARIPVVKS